ncbi:unnamed protein product [Toxocara canis]|uniref:Uncharacterized protein n=1 Tax=Toxocara canis TaxID=6265 RepID=A0A183UN38_TOXCA|nr:unnamed protein product [Toxocara canis]
MGILEFDLRAMYGLRSPCPLYPYVVFEQQRVTPNRDSTPGDVVPVLLSPVLSRPVRSLSAQYAFARQAAVSDSEPELCCTIGQRRPRISRPSDSSSSLQTPPRCVSPAIAHSPLSSRFSACNADAKASWMNILAVRRIPELPCGLPGLAIHKKRKRLWRS